MRVLMFVPKYPPVPAGGLERQAHLLGRELLAQGSSVHVVSIDGASGEGATRFEGIGVSRLSGGRVDEQARNLAGWLMRYVTHFDVCHIHGLSSVSVYVATLCRLRRVPALVKLPNYGPAGIPGMTRRALGGLWKAGFKRADAVVAMTHQSLAELRAIGYPRDRVLSATNGVRLPSKVRDHSRGSAPVFLFAGRIEANKGIRQLISAWRLALPGLPLGSKLRVVGSGPLEHELRATVDANGLSSSVELVEWTPNVLQEYLRADVCVLPSFFEGNSNMILEAMAAGVPVVATDVGGSRMLLGPEGAPLVCAAGDVAGLAARLTRLGNAPAERSSLGFAMRTRAETTFSITSVARAYGRAYAALASGRRKDVQACSFVSLERP